MTTVIATSDVLAGRTSLIELLIYMSNVIIFQTSGELTVKNLDKGFIEDLELETPEDSWFVVTPNQHVGEDLEPGKERVFRVEIVDGDQSNSVLVKATAFVSGIEESTTKSVRAHRANS